MKYFPTAKLTKKRVRHILVAVAVLIFLSNGIAYRHAYALLHFTDGGAPSAKPESLRLKDKARLALTGVNIPRPSSSLQPDALAPDCQSINIAGTNTITLGAWYCNQGKDTPLVILFHGYTAEKSSLIPEAKIFLSMGLSVMLVDFRGSGESSESSTTIGYTEGEDVTTVVRYVQGHFTHSQIILFGRSMGAAAILKAVHDQDISPDGIIAEAVFDTMLHTIQNRFDVLDVPSFPGAELLTFWGGVQTGFNGFKHNPVEYARAVRCPVLFMHGANDPRATITEGREVYDAITAPGRFKEFPSIGHQAYAAVYPQEWMESVSSFIRQINPNP